MKPLIRLDDGAPVVHITELKLGFLVAVCMEIDYSGKKTLVGSMRRISGASMVLTWPASASASLPQNLQREPVGANRNASGV
jgi:hypothetical protein